MNTEKQFNELSKLSNPALNHLYRWTEKLLNTSEDIMADSVGLLLQKR